MAENRSFDLMCKKFSLCKLILHEYLNVFEPKCLLTYCLWKAIDSLAISICLIPYECVGQIGWGVEPLLKEMTLHSHHQVHLDQAKWHHCLGHGDLQQRAVACRSWAQVTQFQIGTWYLNQFVKNLKNIKASVVNSNWWKYFSLRNNKK